MNWAGDGLTGPIGKYSYKERLIKSKENPKERGKHAPKRTLCKKRCKLGKNIYCIFAIRCLTRNTTRV